MVNADGQHVRDREGTVEALSEREWVRQLAGIYSCGDKTRGTDGDGVYLSAIRSKGKWHYIASLSVPNGGGFDQAGRSGMARSLYMAKFAAEASVPALQRAMTALRVGAK